MLNLAYRNLKVFFRDKMSVFFSLLSVFIIIGLYVLFLGDVITADMEGIEGSRFLMDSWIMAGILAVASITTTIGAFGIMVEDRAKKNIKDFQSSPLKRYEIAGGYIISSFSVGIIMSLVALALSEIYIVSSGGSLLSIASFLKVISVIIISVISSSSMVYFIVSFFSSTNAFATASTVIGTLIGFLTGVYIPIGTLPAPVQSFIKIFPVSHSAALLRQIIMDEPIKNSFEGIPKDVLLGFKEQLGVTFKYGDYIANTWIHIGVLVLTAILFYGLAIFNLSRKKNK